MRDFHDFYKYKKEFQDFARNGYLVLKKNEEEGVKKEDKLQVLVRADSIYFTFFLSISNAR